MRTTRYTETRCPHCDARCDSASDLTGDNTPGPGDLSLCLACTQPAIFTDDLSLRVPTREEAREILGNPQIRLYRQHLLKMDRRNLETRP